jgi:hypothetical protein
MIQGTLTGPEIALAYMVAGQRQAMNLCSNRKPRSGTDPNLLWETHVIGCLGEMAVAKAYNRFWSGAVGDYHALDVSGVQVRATKRPEGDLWVYPDDDDSRRFYLVRINCLQYSIIGWILGGEAKRLGKETKPGVIYVGDEFLTAVNPKET